MPLAFVGRQYLQYHNGSREAIPSSYTYANGIGFHTEDYPGPASEPPSFLAQSPGLWARNPIPDHKMVPHHNMSELEFPAPCHDDTSGPTDGLCSGERPFHIAIVDVLQIPTDIPAGDYVVGWRLGAYQHRFRGPPGTGWLSFVLPPFVLPCRPPAPRAFLTCVCSVWICAFVLFLRAERRAKSASSCTAVLT